LRAFELGSEWLGINNPNHSPIESFSCSQLFDWHGRVLKFYDHASVRLDVSDMLLSGELIEMDDLALAL